jgi:exopolysaccharide production protein ExoQ
VVFVAGFAQALAKGLIWIRHNQTGESIWFLLYLTNLVLANLSESSLLNRNDIFWLLYVSMSFSLVMTATKTSNIPIESQN